MDIEPAWLVGVVVLTLLTLLLTGPGMWSEKWGWGWFDARKKRKRGGGAPGAPTRGGGRDGDPE